MLCFIVLFVVGMDRFNLFGFFLLRDEVDDQEEAVEQGRGAAVQQNFVFVVVFVRLCKFVLLAEHGARLCALCRLGCSSWFARKILGGRFLAMRSAHKNGRWPDGFFKSNHSPALGIFCGQDPSRIIGFGASHRTSAGRTRPSAFCLLRVDCHPICLLCVLPP